MEKLFTFNEENAEKQAYVSAYNIFTKWVENNEVKLNDPKTMVTYLEELSNGYPRYSQKRDTSYVKRRFNRVMTVATANKDKIKLDKTAITEFFTSGVGTPVATAPLAEKRAAKKKATPRRGKKKTAKTETEVEA